MKLQEEKTFNSLINGNAAGHVRSMVLGFGGDDDTGLRRRAEKEKGV
jgi:hypothetical protein